MSEVVASPSSRLGKFVGLVGLSLAVVVAVMALYTAAFGALPPVHHRPYALLLCAAVLILNEFNLVKVYRIDNPRYRVLAWLFDVLLLVCIAIAAVRFFPVYERIQEEFYLPDIMDSTVAFFGIAALMEIARRVWGPPLLIVSLVFLSYLIWGEHLPQSIAHVPYTANKLAQSLWYGFDGVFSTIMGVVLNLVFVFIVFGVLLEATGAGSSLLKISLALSGRTRGGPAHAAIIASSMFGTMSGSTIANVVGTGTFTIPMILKRGFSPRFAAGLEATASAGGQILPPIMGAAAFIMADLTGEAYLMICLAALIPALLYYYNLFISVSIEARKKGIQPLSVAEQPKLTRNDWTKALLFILPVATVIGTMLNGYSPAYAGFLAVVVAVIAGLFNPELRADPLRLAKGLSRAGINASSVFFAVAMIGMIIAAMNITGAGLKFAGYIEYLGGGDTVLSLTMAMLGALLLGMGMPTLPAYLVIITVLGPAIEQMGLTALTIHMFVFYFGVASAITPPVALASYAAASISGANPLQAGVTGVRLGAPIFLIPYMFAFNPTLLIIEQFEWFEFVFALTRLLIGLYLMSSVLARFDRRALPTWEFLARAGCAIGLLATVDVIQWISLAAAVTLIGTHTVRARSALLT